MGIRRRSQMQCWGSAHTLGALTLCVVALQGVLVQVGAAAPLCGDNCSVTVRPVCGADGRSYSNGCVASCAGVAVSSQGYCEGDKVRFKQPASSITFLHSPWRAAKESGHVITAEVMNKFAAEGFVYRGKVDMAQINQRTGYKAAPAHRGPTPKEHSAMFQQEASTTATQAAARPSTQANKTAAATAPTTAAGSSQAAAAAKPLEGGMADEKVPPRTPPAAAAVEARPAQASGSLDVAVVRVDNAGNLYTKTYTYDPARYAQMAYAPFNPAGATLVENKVSTGAATKVAAATPAAQQQRAAKAAVDPTTSAAAAKPGPASATSSSSSRQAPGAAGRVPAAGSQGGSAAGTAVRAPVTTERKATSGGPLSAAPAAAAVSRQQAPEGATKLDLQQQQAAGQGRGREQQQTPPAALAGNATSNATSSGTSTSNGTSSMNVTAGANGTAAAANATQAVAPGQQSGAAAAADLLAGVTPQQQQPLKQKLMAPAAPLQLEKEALTRVQQQQPLSAAANVKRPDYMTTPVRQGMSELAKDAVRQALGSSSSSSSGKVTDPVQKVELIPELAAVDPKAFGEQPLLPAAPSSSSSSSGSKAAAAAAAPVQGANLKLESAAQQPKQQQQQQQQPKQQRGPQQMSAATIVTEEAAGAAEADDDATAAVPAPAASKPVAPTAAASNAGPTKAAPAAPAAAPAAATTPLAATTKREAATVGTPATKQAPAAAPAAGAAAPGAPKPAGQQQQSQPAAAISGAAPKTPAVPSKQVTGAAAAADPAPAPAPAPTPSTAAPSSSANPPPPPAAAAAATATVQPVSSSSSSSGAEKAPGGARPPAKALPPCDSQGLHCRDKILATSPMFGTQSPNGKFMDYSWMAGKGRISGVKMFYNKTSGCVRGLQLTYKPTGGAAAGSSGSDGRSSGSNGGSSGPVVKLLGSGYTHAGIVVRELRLKEGEVIGKAEVWDPKCIKFLRLYTSKGQKVAVGRMEPGSEGQARNVTKNRDNGMLVAVKGWQDPPKKHAATAKKPAGSSPGVLKQLQFVWAAPYCDHKCTPPAAVAAAAPAAAAAAPAAGQPQEPTGTIITESGSLPNAGHKRRLLQQQQQQQWLSGSIDRRLSAQQHLQEARQRQRLAAAAAAAEAQQPPLLLDVLQEDEQGPAAEAQQQQQQRRRLAAAAAEVQEPALEGVEDDAWATAELETAAALQQGLWGSSSSSSSSSNVALTSSSSSSSANGSVVVPANIHRMLSVIKPDNRLPCPVKSFPYYSMGQIKAKASDGGFVCSGGLIGSNRVLTAGHCVWDDRNGQGPFKDLRFAPGQWKVGAKVESPLGFVDWDYVTLFDSYINDPDGEGLPFDVAVITLNKPVGTELGWLGVRADAPPCRATPLSLNLAGYPGEDPENPRVGGWAGGCFYDKCDVSYSCSVSITNHTCDSFVGQSGAPMFDDENYVRAVHTLGVLPGFSSTNGAITIQKFMLDNVMGYWRDTSGYSQTKTAAQAARAESAKRGKKRFRR